MTNSSSVFSLVGKNLKLNSKADIQPYLDELNRTVDLQEIHLGGNTFGVEACQALADVLKTKHTLKVSRRRIFSYTYTVLTTILPGCGLCRHLYWPTHLGDSRCTASSL